MPAKIKSPLLKATSILDLPEISRQFAKNAEKPMKGGIVAEILKGKTVVSQRKADPKNTGGKLRFQKYSESYKEKFGKGEYTEKRERPVNLWLTGKMLRSMKSRVSNGVLTLWFSDEKAKYHNKEGAGKSKVIRRILPQEGEDFTPILKRRLINILEKAIRNVAK